ncbi:MAG: efflux RND transporter periplasmic adaptor subunit [Anaerolineae bacterium]|jgi:RND family efflux transporter MFP subunit|nr:efflux RND transporter periplasmic adaptor subunit [Anaerolineae bacterium]MBT7069904.1 efflux RND transporter periplasmic adaptor subunit [Anaerolineae bacterium]MBT7323865.1 efflux RND transporter periplasmic adaptor subunit [Anaerolineae bacterium]
MKYNRWLLLLTALFMLTLTACGGGSSSAEPIPTLVLADIQNSEDTSSNAGGATVSASAAALPANSVSLSFPFTGSVVDIAVADGDTVAAGDVLVQLDTTILQAKVAEAEANIKTAETQVNYLRRITNTSAENIQAAEAEVARQQAILDAALENLNLATLTTPIGGTVASVSISLGETVTPGLIVVVIGDMSVMQLDTSDLSERDIPQVKVGQTVSAYFDALDQEMSGKVSYIATQASSLGGDVVYTVTITLDEEVPGLRWGMSAEVKINVEG